MKVLFIDSGIGGITTLCECIKLMPNLGFIYYADDKYSPYGNLSEKTITNRLIDIISTFAHSIDAVVLACNTATANSIDILRKIYSFPIIGTEPAINLVKKGSSATILATPSTIKQQRFKHLIEKSCCKAEVFGLPSLAKLIDNYFLYGDTYAYEEIERIVRTIAVQSNSKYFVLGCTHYVHIKRLFQDISHKVILDGNYGVAKRLKSVINGINCTKSYGQKFVVSTKNKNIVKKYRKIFNETLANMTNIC